MHINPFGWYPKGSFLKVDFGHPSFGRHVKSNKDTVAIGREVNPIRRTGPLSGRVT